MNKVPVMQWVIEYVQKYGMLPAIETLVREGYTITDSLTNNNSINSFHAMNTACKRMLNESDYFFINGVFAFTTPEMAVTAKLSTE